MRKENLTNKQSQGLRQLSQTTDIIIKKADKGSAIVVMNATDNLREGYCQLSDSNFYTKLDHDPSPTITEAIDKTLHQMKSKGLINENNI